MAIEIKPSTGTQLIIGRAIQKQQQLQDVSIQIASGNKHQDFKGFAEEGTVERFLSFNSSYTKINSYIGSNDLLNSRLQTMSQNVSQLQDIAADVQQLITLRRNSASGEDIPLDVQGASILDNIAGKLNARFDGRYLFAGSKTDTQPVTGIQTSNIASGAATPSYYRGDSKQVSIKINDSQELSYGVMADDASFQQLIGAVHLAMDGHLNNDDDTLAAASDMIGEAISNLASIRATLVASQQTVAQATAVHRDVSLLIQKNLIDVSQTDVVEATTRMSELEATVQASYLAFNRLNGLRLSNFLN